MDFSLIHRLLYRAMTLVPRHYMLSQLVVTPEHPNDKPPCYNLRLWRRDGSHIDRTYTPSKETN